MNKHRLVRKQFFFLFHVSPARPSARRPARLPRRGPAPTARPCSSSGVAVPARPALPLVRLPSLSTAARACSRGSSSSAPGPPAARSPSASGSRVHGGKLRFAMQLFCWTWQFLGHGLFEASSDSIEFTPSLCSLPVPIVKLLKIVSGPPSIPDLMSPCFISLVQFCRRRARQWVSFLQCCWYIEQKNMSINTLQSSAYMMHWTKKHGTKIYRGVVVLSSCVLGRYWTSYSAMNHTLGSAITWTRRWRLS
jgi:hypothetical protein